MVDKIFRPFTGSASSYDFNVKAYGAKGDARKVTDAVITSANGGKTVTSATANFTAADVGKIIWGIETATGAARLPVGTITARNSATSITVSIAATGSYSDISLVFGSDDADAIRAAAAAAKAAVPPGKVVIPPGGYIYSKLLFDLQYSDGTDTISVEGAGPGSTFFYLHPSFDKATTSDSQSTILRTDNAERLSMRGFTVDQSALDFNMGNVYLFANRSANSSFEDVQSLNARNSPGFFNVGSHCTFTRVRAVAAWGHGIQNNSASATFIECYGGNCVGGFSLLVYNQLDLGDSFFRWIGGNVDESELGAVSVQMSIDVSFIGAKLFGPVGAFGLTADGTSRVSVIGGEIVAFGGTGNGNRSALKVLAGGVVALSCVRLLAGGTGKAIDNAGTIIDVGGNSVTGTISGAGTITRPQLSMT